MRPRVINGLLLAIVILLWLLLLGFHLMQQMVSVLRTDQPLIIGSLYYRASLVAFWLSSLMLAGRLLGNIEKLHISGLLWRLFMTGMVGVSLILVSTFVNRMMSNPIKGYLSAFFFCLALAAVVAYFLSALFIFRRLIFYPRTRRKITTWQFFTAVLLVGMVYPVYGSEYWERITYVPLVLVSLLLCSHVRWVSYLNFNQKLRALGLLSLNILVMITYLVAEQLLPQQLGIRIDDSVFEVGFLTYVVIFSMVYSIFSVLVLFFNLPTSSVFERESLEIASFEKINQAIQANLDFTEILRTLLDACLLTANARAGWIELTPVEGMADPEIKIRSRISGSDVAELRESYNLTQKVLNEQKFYLVRHMGKHKSFRNQRTRFRTLLCVPVYSNSTAYGAVFIVSDLVNAFEEVTIKSVSSYAEQAGIALENARLIKSNIELERYQEQLKIAKEVQTQLLPRQLPGDRQIEMFARSENADEVGGDYFDAIKTPDGRYRVAIGDVSGKGTTAAFYMAEVKGVFHALAALDLDPHTFVATANQAMSECMQKGAFVTLTYLEINPALKQVAMIRAGHCPGYFYCAANQSLRSLREGTLGLGILRSGNYRSMMPAPTLVSYRPGDVLVLFTDGIVEARDEAANEFGYERIEAMIRDHARGSAGEIADAIVNSAKLFTRSKLQDDYTVLVIRFT
ncbi:MAG: hypothetical protein EAZ89_00565 [Bacteroidetes bacterium]|nr:MAG: hypothetical protein EAZ89_00565 [Bacteroidota bacterium]